MQLVPLRRGLVPRAVSDLFKRLSQKPGTVGVVRVSYAEIYNGRGLSLAHNRPFL
jgi:hypothetical protein